MPLSSSTRATRCPGGGKSISFVCEAVKIAAGVASAKKGREQVLNSLSARHAERARRSAEDAVSVMRVKPSRGLVSLKLDELWQYHELLYFLTWRDIKVRYKQTV